MSGKTLLGWREWVALPDLGIPRIKAKIDTGARTSTLHAFRVESFMADGAEMARFWIHPRQRRTDIEFECVAAVIDRRVIRDSGGHAESRPVIRTRVRIGPEWLDIEASLTDRDPMLFRMLLGRTALRGRFQVDPGASYLLGGRRPRKSSGQE